MADNLARGVAIVGLVISLLSLYYSYFAGPYLQIVDSPLYNSASAVRANEPLSFSLKIFNSGRQPAFIQYAQVDVLGNGGSETPYQLANFSIAKGEQINSGETRVVDITLPASGAIKSEDIRFVLNYGQFGENHLYSEVITVKWLTN